VSTRPTIACCASVGCACLAAVALSSACDGVDNSEIYTEPILVHGAQFFPGELPGTLPPPDAATPPPSGGPVVTSIQAQNTTIYSGEGGWQLSGDATSSASAIGIRLGELGTGYWVLPMGNPDPVLADQLTFGALIDFNPTITPGIQPLRIVAVTADGAYGEQSNQNLCISSRLPADPGSGTVNEITACSATANPPAAIFALTWDADVDLDLHVITPTGLDVNPKAPLVEPIDAGGTPPKLDPRIDRDSISYCAPDGWREEDLVFPTYPASGSIYEIHANLFSACGIDSVTFTLTTYVAAGRQLVQTFKQSGTLTSIDADGDASGELITAYPF
jgi:hypothetical protein